MPPSAWLNRPSRRLSAPVNAPFSCPNSSLLKRLGVIAPQFTLRNGPLRRSDRSWMASATDSLPEPVSPRISTVVRVGAASSMRCRTSASSGHRDKRSNPDPTGV